MRFCSRPAPRPAGRCPGSVLTGNALRRLRRARRASAAALGSAAFQARGFHVQRAGRVRRRRRRDRAPSQRGRARAFPPPPGNTMLAVVGRGSCRARYRSFLGTLRAQAAQGACPSSPDDRCPSCGHQLKSERAHSGCKAGSSSGAAAAPVACRSRFSLSGDGDRGGRDRGSFRGIRAVAVLPCRVRGRMGIARWACGRLRYEERCVKGLQCRNFR